MDINISDALRDYYARERETISKQEALRTELQALGVMQVHADYDGVGDSGQIEILNFWNSTGEEFPHQGPSIEVNPTTEGQVRDLFYALLHVRHDGWENNDGAFGFFRWNLVEGTIDHEHNSRYTEYDTTTHEGFEVGDSDEGNGT